MRERLSYDHVGVTACLYDDDASGIVGRISKARRALNAISGLGIRRNGLSMYTCCMIFWSIIVPIALFGCEMWVLNDCAVKAIEEFQVYAGKKIQRLFSKSPNICAFYGLGWIRLERLVEIRKLLFVRSLLALNPDDPSRSIFCSRLDDFLDDREASLVNQHVSIVFDIFQVANTFDVLDDVTNMVRRGHVWSKYEWRKKIWEKAKCLDACMWRVNRRCYRNLDLLTGVCDQTKCLVWWDIANVDYHMLKRCETMVKIVSHSSMLRMDVDAQSLKGSVHPAIWQPLRMRGTLSWSVPSGKLLGAVCLIT